MRFQRPEGKTNDYSVEVQEFKGPLDLLLQLIEKAELDITKISLARVTEQFLIHLRQLSEIEAEDISGFLIVAAKLIQIKSEMLLPNPSISQSEEEDVGDELIRQLILYKKFKELASSLKTIEASGKRTYLRVAPVPDVETEYDISELQLSDLINSLTIVLNRTETDAPLSQVITTPKYTIRQKIDTIAEILRKGQNASFKQFLSEEPTKDEIVAAFLALLELIKRHLVKVFQKGLFDDIHLQLSADWEDDKPFELEFDN